MAPIYNVLTDNLNIELVYIILKSITQFAFIHIDKATGRSTVSSKKKSLVISEHSRNNICED